MASLRDRDRGPQDFDPDDPRYLRAVIEGLTRQNNSYHEKGQNAWTAGIGATLLAAFIIGGWSLSNQVAASQAQQVSTQRQIDDLKIEVQELKRIIEQRVRP